MIKPSVLVATGALALVAAAAIAQPAAPVDVRATMQGRINPAMLAIWEVGNAALDENGGIDPKLMDDAKWARIAEAAAQLATAGKDMAGAGGFLAATPGNAAVGEGEVAMSEVQRHIDADSPGFREAAAALAEHAGKIAVAAKAQDAATAGALIGETDAVCESCHSRFWYPE